MGLRHGVYEAIDAGLVMLPVILLLAGQSFKLAVIAGLVYIAFEVQQVRKQLTDTQ